MSGFVVCENKIMLGEIEVSESDTKAIQMLSLMMGEDIEKICERLNAVLKVFSDAFLVVKRIVEYLAEVWNIAKEELYESQKEEEIQEQEKFCEIQKDNKDKPLFSKIYCKKGNPRKEKRNKKWKKRQKPP